jgi:hypothetical protein
VKLTFFGFLKADVQIVSYLFTVFAPLWKLSGLNLLASTAVQNNR